MGRPSKSIEEHKKNGTYRPSRHGVPQPVPDEETVEQLECPRGLSQGAVVLWDELAPLLKGRVQKSDARLLHVLCTWWARLDAVNLKLDRLEPGSVEYGRLIIQAGITTDKVMKMASAFGLSPADRQRLKTEASTPAATKVPTRPQTKLDRMGAPKKGKP